MRTSTIAVLSTLASSVWGAAQVVVFSGPNCQGDSQKLPNGDDCVAYQGQSVWATESDNGVHYSCSAYVNGCGDKTNQEIDYSTCYTNTDGTIYVGCQDNDPLRL